MMLSENCVLVVIDVQEAFRSAIIDSETLIERISTAIHGFLILNLPVIVTEQYPKGLGKTVAEIRSLLPETFDYVEKNTFSSFRERLFVEKLKSLNVKQIVVCGIESHICVNQTVADLIANGYEVHILSDCISSRTEANRNVGFEKMLQSSAIKSSLETALFEIMSSSQHPQFRAIQKLIK